MVIVFWHGLGILLIPMVIGSVLLCMELASRIWGGDYPLADLWAVGVGVVLAAVPNWFLGRWLNNPDRVEEPRHKLFFVPMEYWSPVLAAAGVIWLVALAFM